MGLLDRFLWFVFVTLLGAPPPEPPSPPYEWPSFEVKCANVTYDEAQWILAQDDADPFNLDGDGDGEACESLRPD